MRAACCGRTFVPSSRFLEVAHRLWTPGQDVPEQRLTFRRAGFGRQACPFECRSEIRIGRFVASEKPIGPRALARGIAIYAAAQTAQAQCRQQRLSFDTAVLSGSLEPPRAFCTAGRHARPFEIASRDPVLCVGDA